MIFEFSYFNYLSECTTTNLHTTPFRYIQQNEKLRNEGRIFVGGTKLGRLHWSGPYCTHSITRDVPLWFAAYPQIPLISSLAFWIGPSDSFANRHCDACMRAHFTAVCCRRNGIAGSCKIFRFQARISTPISSWRGCYRRGQLDRVGGTRRISMLCGKVSERLAFAL